MPKPTKSPFILLEDALPADKCEEIILSTHTSTPNRDAKNNPTKTYKYNELAEVRLMPMIDNVLDGAEKHYGFETLKIHPFNFIWMAEGCKGDGFKMDNGHYYDGKWTQTKDIDFTILVFLSTVQKSSITDSLMESFGGNLEFYNHRLTFSPKAGTMLMYPAGANFLNTFTTVELGNLHYIKIPITAKVPYVFKNENFPGNMNTWFN